MILGARHRNTRDFNALMEGSDFNDDDLDTDSNASKRELKPETITPKIIEYKQVNSSAITSEFDVLSSFFDFDVSFKLIFRASNHQFKVK